MPARTVRQTLRSLRRQPLFTAVNVGGLALGVACSLLILLYAAHELRFDRHQPEADRLFRVATDRHYSHGEHVAYATSSPPLAEALAADLPQVERAGRLFSPRWTTQESALRIGDETFRTDELFYGDPALLELLDFRFTAGDPATALDRPDGLVLSERTVRAYFGDRDPLGQPVLLDDRLVLTVTGVFEDPPSSTHAPIHMLAPLAALEVAYGDLLAMWGWDLVYTYVRLAPRADVAAVEAALPDLMARRAGAVAARMGFRYGATLQPAKAIHLHSHRQWEVVPNSRAAYPYSLLGAGLLVLLIAGLNYVNLTTARSRQRSRSVTIHRLLGSRRSQVVGMMLAEATALSVLGGALGLGLIVLLEPLLTPHLGLPEHLLAVPAGPLVTLTLAASAVVGVAAGVVPALRLTRSAPLLTMRAGPAGGLWGRRVLVTAQFAGSIALIAVSLGVSRQLDFVREHDPGFAADRLLTVDVGGVGGLPALKESIAGHPTVEGVSVSSGLPGLSVDRMRVRPQGREALHPVAMLWVDYDFVETLGLELAAGRSFSRDHPSDEHAAFVVNEAAVRAFGWGEAVGQELAWPSAGGAREGEVVGVLRDFHFTSLREPIEPIVLVLRPTYRFLTARVAHNRSGEVLAHLHAVWKEHGIERPLEYRFLDAHLSEQYAAEDRFGRAMALFTAAALLVACLGLFGLAAFTAELRTKEVGIRKVLGATVPQLVALLSREFVLLVSVAFVLAAPLAYLAVNWWLQGFAYRAEVGSGTLLVAGSLALLVALTAVGGQALRAASADPTASLRGE